MLNLENSLVNYLGIRTIYKRKYGWAFLSDSVFLWLPIGVASLIIDGQSYRNFEIHFVINLLYILLVLYILREVVRFVYISRIIHNRHYLKEPGAYKLNLDASAVNSELDNIDKTQAIRQGKHWSIHDITFNFMRHSKYGDYLAKQAFYTVFAIKLGRTLPHVVFDSKQAKGDQFKTVFLKAQRLSFEGNFDDYFESYSPQMYEIDTLSFITPEVLQAILQLRDCDVEIVGDSLLCFAPMLPENKLDDFEKRCRELYRCLNDHVANYRDDRLEGEHRSKGITDFAKRLLENPHRYIVGAFISGTITILATLLILSLREPRYFLSKEFIIAPIIFIDRMYRMISIHLRNKKILGSFIQQNHKAV